MEFIGFQCNAKEMGLHTHAQECEPNNIIKLLYLGGDKTIEVLLHRLGALPTLEDLSLYKRKIVDNFSQLLLLNVVVTCIFCWL